MKKWVFPVIFISIFVFTFGWHYNLNYKIRIAPPSEEWSKDVTVSSGKIKSYPKIIHINGGSIIAHEDNDSIKLVKINQLGQKISEKVLPGEDTLLRYLNLLTDGNNIYVNWRIKKKGIASIVNVTLDKDFNVIKKWTINNPVESIQIGENIHVLSYEDRIEINNIKTGKTSVQKVNSPTMLAGTVRDGQNMISYWENEDKFNYFIEKDGQVSDIKLAAPFTIIQQRDTLNNAALGTDGKYGYIILEMQSRDDGFGTGRLVTFSLEKEDYKISEFRVGDYSKYAYNPVSISSDDGAKFMIACQRKIGIRNTYNNIAEITLKDKNVSNISFVSKTTGVSMYPGGNKDMAVFCSYEGNDNMNVLIASKDGAFKKIYNAPRPNEKKLAVTDTFDGSFKGVSQVFLLGLRWFMIIGVILGILVVVGNRIKSDKSRLCAFSLGYGLSALTIVYVIYDVFFKLYEGVLPGILGNKAFSIFIMIIISLFPGIFAYIKYKDRLKNGEDNLPIFDFAGPILINSILILQVFFPFLP